ncbi:hypothetical protein [Streptomyces sp. NPDC057199]|uniref:hypothetical protein n=1 Tax=Streptomyces sp. NPDC057199 TaxID=3346047 RepID=UPI003628CF06
MPRTRRKNRAKAGQLHMPFMDVRIGGFRLTIEQAPYRLATFLISLATIAGSLSGIAWLNQ